MERLPLQIYDSVSFIFLLQSHNSLTM